MAAAPLPEWWSLLQGPPEDLSPRTPGTLSPPSLSQVRSLSREDPEWPLREAPECVSVKQRISVAGLLLLLGGVLLCGGIRHTPANVDAIAEYAVPNAEVIDCDVPPEQRSSLVILASTALESPAAMSQFVHMVRKLPKAESADPPRLFSGLKVLLLEDAGILKNSFWNPADPNFGQPDGINYEKVADRTGFNLHPKLVKNWTKGFQGLDGGWSYDNRRPNVGLGGIGFNQEDFTYVSIFDLCATEKQAKALFELQSGHVVPSVPLVVDPSNPCIDKFRGMLEQASLIFANGGNPDMLGFVLRKFAPQLGEMIAKRVQTGELLYQGRSAGGMAASRDFGMTYEPNPMLAEVLLDGDTGGLSLAGVCSMRPHCQKNLWNIPSDVFGRAVGHKIVRVANGEGLYCDQGQCAVYGKTSMSEPDALAASGGSLERVYEAYRAVYGRFHPPRPNLVATKSPDEPTCRLVLSGKKPLAALASSGLEDPDAKDAFISLIHALPTAAYAAKAGLYEGLKVLVLDDGAYLTGSYWNAGDKHFAKPDVLNYVKTGTKTRPEVVGSLTQGFAGLDSGWVMDAECGGACGGRFDTGAFKRVSVFDICATDEQKEALFRLQAQGIAPQVDMTIVTAGNDCIERFESMLEEASVLVASSGNPDLLGFVYKEFAPSFGAKIAQRVNEGSLAFLGLGAAAMAFGQNFAASAQPRPALLQKLLKGDLQGLKLAGQCAVIPGWDDKKLLWDLTSSLFEDPMHKVDIIGLPDGALLLCRGQSCSIRGSTRQRPARYLNGPDQPSVHRGRLADVMAAAFN